MKEEGDIFIKEIERIQTSEILYDFSKINKEGRKKNRISFVVEGNGYVINEFLDLVSQRGRNLISTSGVISSYSKKIETKIDLAMMTKWSLALFDFNSIKDDWVKNEVDEFRMIARGCTSRLACINCKKLTALAKALVGTDNEDKEIDKIFVRIHKG